MHQAHEQRWLECIATEPASVSNHYPTSASVRNHHPTSDPQRTRNAAPCAVSYRTVKHLERAGSPACADLVSPRRVACLVQCTCALFLTHTAEGHALLPMPPPSTLHPNPFFYWAHHSKHTSTTVALHYMLNHIVFGYCWRRLRAQAAALLTEVY